MNRFLELKECGGTVLFSELLTQIPPDDVLVELLPDPYSPRKPLVTRRGLEVLKLRLDGLRLPEIEERLGLTSGQVAYASRMTKNCLRNSIPSYVEVDLPALRRLLRLPQKEHTGYTKLSELLRDMPSDKELLDLFAARGNIVGVGGKTPPTHKGLQLLNMQQQKRSYEVCSFIAIMSL